ncbi:hypothetical protein V6N13_023297 [Hibiscus sabdariffa]|uniref:Uncharacterized protein n=1 Tax=Hibiscus sabdariffa TaxID=183260 RepID=A0ABR2B547_9ROSI
MVSPSFMLRIVDCCSHVKGQLSLGMEVIIFFFFDFSTLDQYNNKEKSVPADPYADNNPAEAVLSFPPQVGNSKSYNK